MSRIYFHEKKGVYLHSGICKIPECKGEGVILRHNDTSEIIAVSNKFLKDKFKLVKKFKVEEIE